MKTPLHYICEFLSENDSLENEYLLEFFFLKGANTNAKDCFGQTPVFYLAGSGFIPQGINNIDSDIRKKNIYNERLATLRYRSEKLVKYVDKLVKFGVNLNEKDYSNRSLLDYANKSWYFSAFLQLLKYDFNRDNLDSIFEDILQKASARRNYSAIHFILTRYFDLNPSSKEITVLTEKKKKILNLLLLLKKIKEQK